MCGERENKRKLEREINNQFLNQWKHPRQREQGERGGKEEKPNAHLLVLFALTMLKTTQQDSVDARLLTAEPRGPPASATES